MNRFASMNDFAIFHQRNEETSVSYFPAITVPSHCVDVEVKRLESEGYTVTAVIEVLELSNVE